MSASQAEHGGSIPLTCSKIKAPAEAGAFILGAAGSFSCSAEVNSACAKVLAAGQNACTAQKCRGPEGPLGGSPATVLPIRNIDSNRPIPKIGLPIGSPVFFAPGDRQPVFTRYPQPLSAGGGQGLCFYVTCSRTFTEKRSPVHGLPFSDSYRASPAPSAGLRCGKLCGSCG